MLAVQGWMFNLHARQEDWRRAGSGFLGMFVFVAHHPFMRAGAAHPLQEDAFAPDGLL